MNEREMFWEWAKKENPKLIDEAETGCQFAKDILDYMFMGWVGSANREGYKLVDKKKLAKVLNCVTDDWLIDTGAMNEFKEIESLVADEVESMIGVIK